MFGVKLESIQDFGIERHFLDLLDEPEQSLVLGILPDEIAGLSHGFGIGVTVALPYWKNPAPG
jgi:hypothetical protein